MTRGRANKRDKRGIRKKQWKEVTLRNGQKGGGIEDISPVVFDGSSFNSNQFFTYLRAELKSQRPITESVQIRKENNTEIRNGKPGFLPITQTDVR